MQNAAMVCWLYNMIMTRRLYSVVIFKGACLARRGSSHASKLGIVLTSEHCTLVCLPLFISLCAGRSAQMKLQWMHMRHACQ